MKNVLKNATFTIKRTALRRLLKRLHVAVQHGNKKYTGRVEMTLIDGFVSFNVPGATFGCEVVSQGTAKAAFDFDAFRNIIDTFTATNLVVVVGDGKVAVDTFSFAAETSHFENDKILRSIILAMNYSDVDLISVYASRKYSYDELMFNKLWVPIVQAEGRLRNNINAAARHLKHYGITKDEIKKLLNDKIIVNIHSLNNAYNFQEEKQGRNV